MLHFTQHITWNILQSTSLVDLHLGLYIMHHLKCQEPLFNSRYRKCVRFQIYFYKSKTIHTQVLGLTDFYDPLSKSFKITIGREKQFTQTLSRARLIDFFLPKRLQGYDSQEKEQNQNP